MGEVNEYDSIVGFYEFPDGTLGFKNPQSEKIWKDRYQKNGETLDENLRRVAYFVGNTDNEKEDIYWLMREGKFFFAGRTMSNAGCGKDNTLNNCLGGKVKFLTDKGYRRLMDCKDGEVVRVKDMYGVFREATVHKYGIQKRIKIKLQYGSSFFELIATPNHRWILDDGTITTELKVGDRLWPTPDSTQYEITNAEEAEAFALGFIIGDGCDVHTTPNGLMNCRLCNEKIKYADIFAQAGYRVHNMQGSSDLKVSYRCAMKQDFLSGHGWRFMPLNLRRLVFLGYYAADGATGIKSAATSDERIAQFIEETSALAGYYISTVCDKIRDTQFKQNARLITYHFYTSNTRFKWKVVNIEATCPSHVYCVEEPVTHSFTLERGIVTGNCFTLNSVPDSMEGIFETVKTGALTQKAGGGTGYDFSMLRPKGAETTNGAVASGPVSFMSVFNQATETILSQNRRGANMSVLNVYHPDIEEYINCKNDPDHPDTMQYFNMSVMVDDAFMWAVKQDKDVYLHYPVYDEAGKILYDEDKWTYKKRIKAKDLWEKITRKAYESGEPGVLFYGNMNSFNTVQYCEEILGTNPCGK